MQTVSFRRANPASIPDLVDCERESHANDKDGLPPYAKNEDQIVKMAKAAVAKGSKTRLITLSVPFGGGDHPGGADWHCGAVHFQKLKTGFHVNWVTAHPSTGIEVYDALFRHVMSLTSPEGRQVVTVRLPDSNPSYRAMKALKGLGFEGLELHRSNKENVPDYWKLDWVNEAANV